MHLWLPRKCFIIGNCILTLIMIRWRKTLWKNFNLLKLRYSEPCNFLKNVHCWAKQARLWLLRAFRIIWIYQCICQRLSLPLYHTHPTWLSLTNELKFDDYRYQINSLSLINLLLLIIKFSFICEGQSCRVRITFVATNMFKETSKYICISTMLLFSWLNYGISNTMCWEIP